MAFPTPRNLNYWWTFGGILTFMLVSQIATGIVLAMHYVGTPDRAFDSIEHLMRDVNWGWLLRYTHTVGASMFFLAAYIHTLRGLYYGSYKAPREVLWILGVLILLLMIATAFMGYSLVWGQMSFWAITVITNLFSSLDAVVPGIGTRLVEWIWGGFAVGGPTLTRLYSLHYFFPFVIAGVVVLHIWALHIPGNNNPTGIDVKSPREAIPFHPYYTIKDGFALALFALFFAGFVFYAPNYARPSRQLHPGQSVADAGAHRARMVLPAVLRNPARHPEQTVRRRRTDRLDRHPVLRALARHLAGALDALPADLQMVLLGVRGDLLRARLSRLAAAGRRLSRARPHLHRLLFPVLPLGDAGGRLDREAEGTAGQHHRIRARAARGQAGLAKARAATPCAGAGGMRMHPPFRLALAASLVIALALSPRAAFAADEAKPAEEAKPAAEASSHAPEIESQDWTFTGPFGAYDNAQLQRGYAVYKNVCAACHSMRLLSYRNLGEPGGPGFSPEAVATLAAEAQVTDGPNDKGEMFQRPGRPSDRFRSPLRE